MAKILSMPNPDARTGAGAIAEARVVELLSELPDDYSIICNVTICDEKGTRARSELDTVVVTPLGAVALLEVKSGNVDINEHGSLVRSYAGRDGEKDLSKQLSLQQHLLRTRLLRLAPNIASRHYLVLPNGRINAEGVTLNDLQSHLVDCTNLETLPNLMRQLNSAASTSGNVFDKAKVEAFFCEHYTFRASIAALCDSLQAEASSRTSGLAAWVPRIHSPLPGISVKAPAGAGKTELAVKILEAAVAESKRCAYLTFSRNNAENMRKTSVAIRAGFVGTWHELAEGRASEEIDLASLSAPERRDVFDRWSENLVHELDEGRLTWDVVIVDDAQDFSSDWVQALAQSLSETGRIFLLSDPYAKLYSDRGEMDLAEDMWIEVGTNETLRLPQVRVQEMQSLGLVGSEFSTSSRIKGESTYITEPYTGNDSLRKLTQQTLSHFLSMGFRTDQIAILSWQGLESSEFLKHENLLKIPLNKPTGSFDANKNMVFTEGELHCDTLRRFTGQSAPCVIVTEIDFDEVDENVKHLLYHAMSRSSIALAFVMSARARDALNRYIASLSS